MKNWWWRQHSTTYIISIFCAPILLFRLCGLDGLFSYFPAISGWPRSRMGAGLRQSLKWVFPIQSHLTTNSPSRVSPSSARGKEVSTNLTRLSFLSVVSDEGDIYKHHLKGLAYPSTVLTLDNDCSQIEEAKMNVCKRSHDRLNNMIDVAKVSSEEDNFMPHESLNEGRTSQFSLLMENIDILEKSFADSRASQLEQNILLHLGRLGALNFFHTCLSRTLKDSNVLDLADVPTETIEDCKSSETSADHLGKIIIRTGKKDERKSKRERACRNIGEKATFPSLASKPGQHTLTSAKKSSNSKSRRLATDRNEAELSRGVKMLSNLERIRKTMEEESGRVVGLSCWAEAAGLDKKMLQKNLHFGWYCRDELVRSARPLVMYLARNYRGLGVALDDLLLAGDQGVLLGAERFDPTKGYRFSTYVHYWIRKSMLEFVTRHARGILIPRSLRRAINQIQKARKVLSDSHGKYPDDKQIAKFTGLSLAKIESAGQCLRVVSSIDQKIADGFSAKYLEFMTDESIQSPENAVMRQNMREDIYNLLRGLNSRDRQMILLRYGFKDNRPRSLAEIGRVFHVSKEWVRKIEQKVMVRLRNEETCRKLSHYSNL